MNGDGFFDLRLASRMGREVSIQAQASNLNRALDLLQVTPLRNFAGFANITVTLERVITEERSRSLMSAMTTVRHVTVFIRPFDDAPVFLRLDSFWRFSSCIL